MKIVGIATIELLHADGRREVVGKDELNHICYPVWRRFFTSVNNGPAQLEIPIARTPTSQNSGSNNQWWVYYGAKDVHPTPLNCFYNHDGRVRVDQNTPYWTDRATVNDPDVMTFTAVIPAPSNTPRTISTLGIELTTDTSSSFNEQMTYSKLTILRLTNPCIQAVNVTVIVTYRLYIHPAVASTNLNVSDTWWDRMRSILKTAATPSNALVLTYNNLNAYITSSCYDYAAIPNYSTGSITYSYDAAEASYELTDNGFYRSTRTNSYYSNVIRSQFSFDTTSPPAVGVWVKCIATSGMPMLSINTAHVTSQGLIHQLAVPSTTSPIQNVFQQRNTPPGPFQDLTVNNTATMTGSVVYNASAWTDPSYQQVTKVTIVGSGAVGVSTYRVSTMSFLAGFVGNQWIPRTALLPQAQNTNSEFKINPNAAFYETKIIQGGTTYRSPDGDRLVVAADCSRTAHGVSVYDVITGTKYNFNANTGLPVTAVADVDVSNGFIYVACANTGLWRIHPDLVTVEAIPTPTGVAGAYQISAKRDGNTTLWVMHNGGLCHLTNPAAAVGSLVWSVHNASTGSPTFTYAGISDANWANVTAMAVDPDHANNRMLIMTAGNSGDTSGFNRRGYVWWDTATGVAVAPSVNGVDLGLAAWTVAELVTISDNLRCIGGRWAMGRALEAFGGSQVYHFTYGATNLSATYFNSISFQRLVPGTINGIDGWIASRSYYSNTGYSSGYWISTATLATIPNATSLSPASPYVDFMLRQGVSTDLTNLSTQTAYVGLLGAVLIYLPTSNMFFTQESSVAMYGVTPFMLQPDLPSVGIYNQYRGAFWRDYGWDGSAWVLNHNGAKPTHAASEAVAPFNGIALAFTNGGSGTSFVANEFFTTCIGKGLMKDNGTTYTVSSYAWTLDATSGFTQTTAIPQTPLGLLTDEPVTFRPIDSDASASTSANQMACRCIQHKGTVVSRSQDPGPTGYIVSDQVIPANTEFDLRYQWIVVEGDTAQNNYHPTMGLVTGTVAFSHGVHFRATGVGQLKLYNGNSIVATINNAEPSKVCRIVRDASNSIQAYYDGTPVGSAIISNSAMMVMGISNYISMFSGWANVTLTYTENRRVLRLGSALGGTGCFSSSFTGLSVTGLVKDTTVDIGTGTPLAAVLDYTVGSNPIVATGNVKVAPGAGWIVFHSAEPADTVTVKTILHHLYNPA